jgi:mannose-1-phosphate guanylyltransferase
MGRDTVNAVGFAAAAIAKRDPDAVIAVFTADHIIEPMAEFRKIVNIGYEIAESQPHSLVTFGISPTAPATGYGYLQLGQPLGANASVVDRFREKPDLASAKAFFAAGPERYLWNSGMFVWRASTLLECLGRYEPAIAAGLEQIAAAWGTPAQQAKLQEVYPTLKKISVDFAVMEPASKDDKVQVAAVPMALQWLDVGSWPMFAETCEKDENANALGAQKHLLKDTRGTLVASSDPNHLIATIGCEDLIVIHTPEATLVCRADQAERIKELHAEIGKRYGASYQ